MMAKDQLVGAAEGQGEENYSKGDPFPFALLAPFQFRAGGDGQGGSEHHPDSLGFQEAHAGKSGQQNPQQRCGDKDAGKGRLIAGASRGGDGQNRNGEAGADQISDDSAGGTEE